MESETGVPANADSYTLLIVDNVPFYVRPTIDPDDEFDREIWVGSHSHGLRRKLLKTARRQTEFIRKVRLDQRRGLLCRFRGKHTAMNDEGFTENVLKPLAAKVLRSQQATRIHERRQPTRHKGYVNKSQQGLKRRPTSPVTTP